MKRTMTSTKKERAAQSERPLDVNFSNNTTGGWQAAAPDTEKPHARAPVT